ncbi:MAG: GNAT family N-acetyltransferase [Pseudomonadota bacterium]
MSLSWSEGPAPEIDEYIRLRDEAGMGSRSAEAARLGLAGGLFAVTVREDGILIAMGRVTGDGGCHAQLTDIAVHPTRQGQGIGTEIVARLVAWCERALPSSCFLSLIADPGAEALYLRAGFKQETGMGRRLE